MTDPTPGTPPDTAAVMKTLDKVRHELDELGVHMLLKENTARYQVRIEAYDDAPKPLRDLATELQRTEKDKLVPRTGLVFRDIERLHDEFCERLDQVEQPDKFKHVEWHFTASVKDPETGKYSGGGDGNPRLIMRFGDNTDDYDAIFIEYVLPRA